MLDCTYTSDTSILIAALLRAFADKADIINVSAGLTGGWTLDAASVIADRISAKGTLVVVSCTSFFLWRRSHNDSSSRHLQGTTATKVIFRLGLLIMT